MTTMQLVFETEALSTGLTDLNICIEFTHSGNLASRFLQDYHFGVALKKIRAEQEGHSIADLLKSPYSKIRTELTSDNVRLDPFLIS